MWLHGAVMAVVCSALLAAADSRLHQDVNDVSSTDTFQCYARYVRTTQEHGVLVVHRNHADVSRYVASIRSLVTIVNLESFDVTWLNTIIYIPKALRMPYGLVVLLAATKKDLLVYHSFIMHNAREYPRTRYLGIGLTFGFGIIPHGLFYMARLLYQFNMVVLNWNDTRVYRHSPYGGGACSKRWHVEVLDQCQQLSFNQLYSHKGPKHYGGCTATFYIPYPPPAVIDHKSESEQPMVAGYQIALLNIIARRLKLTKFIYTYNLNLGISCNPAYPYYTDTLVWYVPVAAPRAQWKSVVLVFQAPLWAAVLVFFLLNTLAWWMLGRISATPPVSYVECVLGSLLMLLNGSVPLPKRVAMRFLVVSWTLCALVLGAAYLSQFLSVLLTPVADKQPITNQQQLLASDMLIDFEPIKYDITKVPNWLEIVRHNDKMRVHSNQPYAWLQFSLTAKYETRNHTDARGKPTLVAFKEPIMYMPLCLVFDRATPVVHAVDEMLRRLVENGIVAKFMQDVDFSNYWSEDEREDEPITMRHLDFAFFLLLLGHALATLAFLLETVVWRTQHGCWRTLCTSARRWRHMCGTRFQSCWYKLLRKK